MWLSRAEPATRHERGSGRADRQVGPELAADRQVGPELAADRQVGPELAAVIARLILGVVLGAVCGSFAALVADRVPRGESVVTGRSACRTCRHQVELRDLIPIVSWVVLRGRCRTCRTSIGMTSPIVEVVTAALFALCALRFDEVIVLVAHWVLCIGLVSLSVIDLFTMKLPRRIIHVTASIGLPLLALASLSTDRPDRLATAMVGALGSFGVMLMLYVVSAGSLGDGDVRISPLLGLYLGWKDGAAVFSGFFLAFLSGAVVGIVVVAVRPAGSSRAIPFGPFLALGTISAVLFDVDLLGTA